MRQRKGKSYRLEVTVAGAYLPTLEAYRTAFGGFISPTSTVNKPVYQWRLGSFQDCIKFLSAMYPFALEKREQIHVALVWLHYRATAQPRDRRWKDIEGLGARTHHLLKDLKQGSVNVPQESESAACEKAA